MFKAGEKMHIGRRGSTSACQLRLSCAQAEEHEGVKTGQDDNQSSAFLVGNRRQTSTSTVTGYRTTNTKGAGESTGHLA